MKTLQIEFIDEVLEKCEDLSNLIEMEGGTYFTHNLNENALQEVKLFDHNGDEINLKKIKIDTSDIIKKNNLKSILCPFLKNHTGTIKDIVTLLVTTLVPLCADNKVNIPYDSLIYASIAITIFYSGVNDFCKN